MINPYIFREYDIRGRIDKSDELKGENLQLLGKGVGTFLIDRGIYRVVMGRDSRPYSKDIETGIIDGLLATGVDVIEIGQVLVPILYFAQYHLKESGGIMITASHNPLGWSGLKIADGFSHTLLGDDVRKILNIISGGKFVSGKGRQEHYNGIIDDYTKDLLGRVHVGKSFRVLVDAGNGTAGPIVPTILRAAGHEVIERHCNLDPTFPHHVPNPSVLEMAQDIADGVKESGADIGFGFDDDGDRLGFADDGGNIVWPDKALIFLARSMLEKLPGTSIVFDVKCTQALIDDIKDHNGVPIMWKTGHSYIKQKAKEVNAALAGERSGHIFFREGYYGFDDATFAALKFLEYLSEKGQSFSELLKSIPQYVTSPVWQLSCPDEKKYGVVDKLTQELKGEYGDENVNDINGARVSFKDKEGWGLVRASSNLPVLVLVFESKSKEGLKDIENIFRERLSKFPEVGKDWNTG